MITTQRIRALVDAIEGVRLVADQTRAIIDRQLANPALEGHPEIRELLRQISRELVPLGEALRAALDRFASEGTTLQGTVASALGTAARWFEATWTEEEVSRMVRDLYVALCLAWVQSLMLEVTARGLDDPGIARLAARFRDQLGDRLDRIEALLPETLACELREEGKTFPI